MDQLKLRGKIKNDSLDSCKSQIKHKKIFLQKKTHLLKSQMLLEIVGGLMKIKMKKNNDNNKDAIKKVIKVKLSFYWMSISNKVYYIFFLI